MKKISRRYFGILVVLAIIVGVCNSCVLKLNKSTAYVTTEETTEIIETEATESETNNDSTEQTEPTEPELDWRDIRDEIDEYFPEIQEELKKGSDSFNDISIEISGERTLILDGHDTNYNIDYITPLEIEESYINGKYSLYVVEDATWICYVDTIQEFFVPNRYNGDIYIANQTRLDSLGNIHYEEMELPNMKFNELPKGYPYYSFTVEDETGEVPAYAPYKYKIVHYIEKFELGESKGKYVVDLQKKYFNSFKIISLNDDKILLENDNVVGVFQITAEKFDIISNDMKDGRLISVDQILFVDSKHDLYLCNWTLNTDVIRVRE